MFKLIRFARTCVSASVWGLIPHRRWEFGFARTCVSASAKLNSFLSYSILLFADLYKVYQTIPIISSKSSGLFLYFPDFFGANPCKIQLNFPHPERVSHADTGVLGSMQLHIHTGSNKSTLCGGSKMKKMIFRIFLFTPPAKSCLSVVHSLQ